MTSAKTNSAVLLPYVTNIKGVGDRISSAADARFLDRSESEEAFVDRFYGHSWSFTPQCGSAVYGLTDKFAPSPVDHLAKGNFLRVPFRRVPVIDVESLDELNEIACSIQSKDKTIIPMWRGQTAGYSLSRSEEDSLRLYGEKSVIEPSLPASASRLGLAFSDVFKSWSPILDAYMLNIQNTRKSLSSSLREQLRNEILNHRSSYNYRLWAFATAQHYGLPSIGLDVTSDLSVALLFALHRFEVDKTTGLTNISRVGAEAEPVLYSLGVFQNDLFDDALLAPSSLQCKRPQAQSAFFMGTGWGLSQNRAAERIFVAFKLKNHTDWKLPRQVESLLPTRMDDGFLDFLLEIRDRYPLMAEEAMLNRVYYAR
jgi:hypothetical protein